MSLRRTNTYLVKEDLLEETILPPQGPDPPGVSHITERGQPATASSAMGCWSLQQAEDESVSSGL